MNIDNATWVNTCPEEDLDEDGFATWEDCNDNDPAIPTEDDIDCNGISDDCFLTPCDISVDMGNGIGADFVLIDELEDPLGRYTLDHPFYMMTTVVTQGMFKEIMGYDSRLGQSTSFGMETIGPAYYTSWHMAAHFANTLSIDQGEEECYICSGSGTSVTCSESMEPDLCKGYFYQRNMNGN